MADEADKSLLERIEETGAGWFSNLFGYNQTSDPSIPNYASNGVDVPMNQPKTVSLWDKYALNWGTAAGASDPTVNSQAAADQTWYSSIWQGAKSSVKFVFCPIFTECPDPLPPGGIKLTDLGSAAGKAVGDTVESAVRPLLPILIVLVVGLVLVNVIVTKVSTAGVK